ncbi:MAG: hypothetical protein IT443_13500 [Phycisphaeraceae bacterium]|nr:hypothetical protein [Phycisphaeraceae bacterium]
MPAGNGKFWAADKILRRPRTAKLILALGAVAYFIFCWPLYGRRGFPEIDPFYLGAAWLWYVPLLIALVFDDRPRWWTVGLYAIAVGFIFAYGLVGAIPSYTTALEALRDSIFFDVIFFLIFLFLTWILRGPYRLIRQLFPALHSCVHCGYRDSNVTQSICPECGQSFDSMRNIQEVKAELTARPWKTRVFLVCVLGSAILTPIMDHYWTFHRERVNGRQWAEQEWAASEARWYVSPEEFQQLTPRQIDRFDQMHDTGVRSRPKRPQLTVYRMWSDWQHLLWQQAYREVIERKLRESGQERPDFGPP